MRGGAGESAPRRHGFCRWLEFAGIGALFWRVSEDLVCGAR